MEVTAAAAAGSRVAAGGADGTDAAGSPMPAAYGAERRTLEPIKTEMEKKVDLGL